MSELRGMDDQPGVPDVRSGVVLGADGPPDFPAHSEPAPVASRERVAEVLHREGHSEPCYYGNPVNCRVAAGAWDRTDALLAAGVFREPPTRDQVAGVYRRHYQQHGPGIVANKPFQARCSCGAEYGHGKFADHLADAVLALINGG